MSLHKVPKPPKPSVSWLDKSISSLFPEWGAKRMAYRAAMHEIEQLGYRSARNTRIGRKEPSQGVADYSLEQTRDRREVVDRARQLERNSVTAESVLRSSVENVVGTGFTLQAGTDDDTWNKKAEELWGNWKSSEADVRGMASFDEIVELFFRSWLRDGDAGLILLADGKVQPFESDQLSSPNGMTLRRDMVDGIELDRRGKPLFYNIVSHPDPINPAVRYQDHQRISANNVLFKARRTRLGQTRGISAFSGSAWLIDQIDGNIEAVTVAARMAAMFGLVLTNARGNLPGVPMSSNTSDGVARPKWVMEPGMVKMAKPGEDVTQIKPEQPTQNFGDFVGLLIRLVAMPFGLPLELFFDFSEANFSNHKAAMLQAQRTWRRYQAMLVDLQAAVYRWKVLRWIREGVLAARRDAFKHSFNRPGWKWMDPEKEIKAAMAEIDAGVNTWSAVTEGQGVDFAQLQIRRKRDLELMAPVGLPIARGTFSREIKEGPQPLTPPKPPEPPE